MNIPEVIGKEIRAIKKYDESGTVVFESEALSIQASCLVRLITKEGFVFGSYDNKSKSDEGLDKAFLEALQTYTLGKSILRAEAKDGVGDLSLEFGNDIRVELVNDSSLYEPWQINFGKRGLYVAAVGGKISFWEDS